MPRLLRAGRLLLAGVMACAACGTANPTQPPIAPTARLGAAMASDPAHGDLVLFGGRTRSRVEGDSWTWTAGRWRRVATPAAPAPRSFAAAAPDGRGGVILFGGDVSDPTGTHDDTWRWDGGGWRQLHPRTVPDAGAFRTMAPGPAGGGPVLVVFRADRAVRTWTWDATAAPDGDWVLAPGPAAPPWRDDSGLVPDPPSHRLLLVGGIPEQAIRAGDTWAWDGTSWAELHPPHRPGGGPVSATDLASGPLLYEEDGTWTWAGGDWTLVRPPGAPSWRPYAALAAIPGPATAGAQAILLTGAAGDTGQTWRWNGRAWTES